MLLDHLPIWLFFILATLMVLLCIEAGFLIGRRVRRRQQVEKESMVSAISGSVLGLLAFILAFTFGFASNRFDSRRQLVLDEAAALQTAYQRADMLPDSARAASKALLTAYLSLRLRAIASQNMDTLAAGIEETKTLHRALWQIAVENARLDLNSDIGALYVESINEIMDIHLRRLTLGLLARIPSGIWLSLGVLTVLATITVGYQTAIAESPRTWITLILAMSFALAMTIILILDRPANSHITVSQRPLEFVLQSFTAPK